MGPGQRLRGAVHQLAKGRGFVAAADVGKPLRLRRGRVQHPQLGRRTAEAGVVAGGGRHQVAQVAAGLHGLHARLHGPALGQPVRVFGVGGVLARLELRAPGGCAGAARHVGVAPLVARQPRERHARHQPPRERGRAELRRQPGIQPAVAHALLQDAHRHGVKAVAVGAVERGGPAHIGVGLPRQPQRAARLGEVVGGLQRHVVGGGLAGVGVEGGARQAAGHLHRRIDVRHKTAQLQAVRQQHAHVARHAVGAVARLLAPAVLLAAADAEKAVNHAAARSQVGVRLPLAERAALHAQRGGGRRQPRGRHEIDRAAQAVGAVFQRIGAAPHLHVLRGQRVHGLEIRRAVGVVQRNAVLIQPDAAHQKATLNARAADGQPGVLPMPRLRQHPRCERQRVHRRGGAAVGEAGGIDHGRGACAARQVLAGLLQRLSRLRVG